MSPVEAPSRGHVGRAGMVSVVAVILVFSGLWLIAVTLGDRNSPDLKLGDQTFRAAGDAKSMAKQIAKNGPIIYTDVSGRKDRDLILQHIGTNPKTGWFAFAAQPPNKARDCTWQWKPKENQFRASCDSALTASANGAGLVHYKVTVNGSVNVDLNFDQRAAASSTTLGPITTR